MEAFERVAESIRSRIHALGFDGVATFYVWHDEQVGQLRCSTGSVAADALPFGGAYVPSSDLGLVIESFLREREPGVVGWQDLEDLNDQAEGTMSEPEPAPLLVWVRSVGAI